MSYNIVAHEGMTLIEGIYSREQRAKRACLHAHLATAARVFDRISLIYHSFDEELLLDVETGKSMPWVRIFYQRFNC